MSLIGALGAVFSSRVRTAHPTNLDVMPNIGDYSGKPDVVKVARPVWNWGKAVKALPIATAHYKLTV